MSEREARVSDSQPRLSAGPSIASCLAAGLLVAFVAVALPRSGAGQTTSCSQPDPSFCNDANVIMNRNYWESFNVGKMRKCSGSCATENCWNPCGDLFGGCRMCVTLIDIPCETERLYCNFLKEYEKFSLPVLHVEAYLLANKALLDSNPTIQNPIPPHMRTYLEGLVESQYLDRARYSIGVTTINVGGPITFGDYICFPAGMSHSELDSLQSLPLWVHELEHVKQYDKLGFDGFAQAYAMDKQEVERLASRKANPGWPSSAYPWWQVWNLGYDIEPWIQGTGSESSLRCVKGKVGVCLGLAAPMATMSFLPAVIHQGEYSKLRITISSPPGNTLPLLGVGLVDNLPAGLEFASAEEVYIPSTCGWWKVSTTSLKSEDAILDAHSSCSIEMSVRGASEGRKVNITEPVTTWASAPGQAATALLDVWPPVKAVVSIIGDTAKASETICPGGAVMLQAQLFGAPPWNLTWSDGWAQAYQQSPATRTVTPAATMTYAVTTVSDRDGPGSAVGSAAITVRPVPPAPVVRAPMLAAAGAANLAASVSEQAGNTYSWIVSNGTFTGGQGTHHITFSAGDRGGVGLSVVETNVERCSSMPGTATVSIAPWTAAMGTARRAHTATLLGNRNVLVAGGWDATGTLNASAELYDPATGQWKATGNLVSARAGHTATLLPSGRVLVAGGAGRDGSPLDGSEIFDPATGTWANSGSLGHARKEHTATLLANGKVLVAGGVDSGDHPVAMAELYDPATAAWTEAGNLGTARVRHTATLLPDGGVLVAGGRDSTGVHSRSAELYDPATRGWTNTGSLGTERDSHTATLLANGSVLVAGGHGPFEGSDGTLDSTEVYDPTTGTWTSAGNLRERRGDHTATLLPSGQVWVTGGGAFVNGFLGITFGPLDSSEIFDPLSKIWTTQSGAPLVEARALHTATLLPGGGLLLAGGQGRDTASVRNSELCWPCDRISELGCAAAGSFSPTGRLDAGRFDHAATLLPNGRVLVTGGLGIQGPVGVAERFDHVSGTWTGAGSLGVGRRGHSATLLANGKVLIVGGMAGNSCLASVELHDTARGTWTTTGNLRRARTAHRAVLLANGKVLVIGGRDAGGPLASCELYDPGTGTWTETDALDVARESHTATLLADGKVLVAGGRSGEVPLGDCELYDPENGTWTTTGHLLELNGRQLHTATLLPSGSVLVAGGIVWSGEFSLSVAELYHPATGTWTFAGKLGTARTGHTATLLPGGRVLVTGGLSIESNYLRSSETYDPATETWEYTGDLVLARANHTATLLPSGKVLIVGGTSLESPPLDSAELYDAGLGFLDAWRPVVTGVPGTVFPGGPLSVTGAQLKGHSESSGGGSQSSATNFPLLQLRRIDNEQTVYLPTDPSSGFSEASLATGAGWSMHPGPAIATVVTSAIPSLSRHVLVVPRFGLPGQNGGTGTIQVSATLNGAPWSGELAFALEGASALTGAAVPSAYPSVRAGYYTLGSVTGGPGGATLSSITPGLTQTLADGGATQFTLNYTTGAVEVRATLNGASWMGVVRYELRGAASRVGGITVPATYPGLAAGSYSLNNIAGGPSSAVLASITPSPAQTLSGGGTTTFTMNYTGGATGTVQVDATLNSSEWTGPVNYVLAGPSVLNGTLSPATHSGAVEGVYMLGGVTGGPCGTILSSITPSSTQVLAASGITTFTLNYTGTVTPAATVSGSAAIPAGGSATIQASLTGTPPWSLTWSDGETQNNITSSPATRTVSPSATTAYSVTHVSDANCTGVASGSAVITIVQEVTVTLAGGVPLVIVQVPAGSFTMGSPAGELGRDPDEGPQHQVTLTKDIYLGKYEVTQAQWQAVMGTTPAHDNGVGPDYPVYFVSWNDICGSGATCGASDGFVKRLNDHLTSTGQPGAGKFRLPSEAEWENAARAQTTGPFSFAAPATWDTACGSFPEAVTHIWWCGNAASTAHPVGQKLPNPWGIFDMHGNVYEWVNDWYGQSYYASTPASDPPGPTTGSYRVARGGFWGDNAQYCRSAYRSAASPGNRYGDIGFRLATSVGNEACTYGISPTSRSHGPGAGPGSVMVTTNLTQCPWTAASSNPSWIIVTAGASGTGSGAVTYSVEANTGEARNGTITIGGQVFTLDQGAVPCTYSIHAAEASFPGAGGNGSVAVTTNLGSCAWQAATSDPSWLTITAGSSISGSGTVQFAVADNPGEPRVGTLTIAGHTFTVEQDEHGIQVRRVLRRGRPTTP
jgi:formylglycine-generating enzyme required for sulfatase activity